MSEDEDKIHATGEPDEPEQEPVPAPKKRRFFSRRNILIAAGAVAIILVVVVLFSVISYRYGVFDNYVKAQFVTKMADMGIDFDADVFRVTVNPLALELKNATFNNRVTGEKLFFIRDAHLDLTVKDLYAWHLNRDISIDKTLINGVEVWFTFNENGRSNFADLKMVEQQPGQRVNFKYDSVEFMLRDGVVHFGYLTRKLEGNARNVTFLLGPSNDADGENQLRYNFDLKSTDSNFTYDQNTVEKIDISASGIADGAGAEFSNFEIRTPIGDSAMTGSLRDWPSPKYDFDIQSSVDLTQASSIFPMGTSLFGVGNFKGKVTGEGESYKVTGQADAEALRAGGIYLKALNVAATVEGTNTNYEANGKAIAEMLTFEDFRIDFLQMMGNVRGNGTDFTWLGDLQAAAAKSPTMSLGGLFLSDALAEYKDRELRGRAGSGRAQQFSIGGAELDGLSARNLNFSTSDGGFNMSAPGAAAGSIKTKDVGLTGVTAKDVDLKKRGETTDVNIAALRADGGNIKAGKLRNVTADRLKIRDLPKTTDFTATNLRADEWNVNGASVRGIESPLVEIENSPGPIVIYADTARVASIDADTAVIGSLNIGGVRITAYKGSVEARSNDFDAGNVELKKTAELPNGGTLEAVKVSKPVYVLEPSGRYRATADMSLGGGALGSIALGAARAGVEVNNDRIALNEINADVMNGKLTGKAVVALNGRTQSILNGDFTDLDLSKLIALQGGRVTPIDGQASGRIDLAFTGTDFRTSSGTVNASITANAGSAESGRVPLAGQVRLSATNGLFNVDVAELHTDQSRASASGRFDLRNENSDLTVGLNSADAAEVERLIRAFGVSPELEDQIDSMQATVAGNLTFDGKITGNLYDPEADGHVALASISLRGRSLGSVSADLSVSPLVTELRNGKLRQADGGSADFSVVVPSTGSNNTEVKATLTKIDAGNLLAALPVDLPERIRDLDGQTSGTVDITGLPNNSRGSVDLAASGGIIAGQSFDSLNVKAIFSGTRIDLETAEMRIGAGRFAANGTYDRASQAFDLDLSGTAVPMPLLLAVFPRNDSIPPISGDIDFTAKATGNADRASTYNVNFDGRSSDLVVNQGSLGPFAFNGRTTNSVLTAELTADLNGHPQVVNATVNFGNEDMPFMVATDFNQSPLAPFISFIPQLKDMPITGVGTGHVEFGGNLSQVNDKGVREMTGANLSGTARFSQLALQIQDTPLTATEPVLVRFNTREVVFEQARFAGGGSNMTIAGTKAMTDEGINNISIDGRINLNLLNLISRDTFFSGFADASVRLSGPNKTARLSGSANVVNGSVATFLGSDRFTVDRLQGRVIFTSNQIEVDEATGYLGGGKFTASGGGIIEGLTLKSFRFSLNGNNVTVPLPKDFVTTGDAQLDISGIRRGPSDNLQLTVSGRVFARRSIYSKDIDLASIVGSRRDAILTGGGSSSISAPRFDLIIEGRDALIVRNNVADLTASVSLTLTGDADNPRLSGRITADRGVIFFRKDRYDVQRGVLEFPPDTAIDPVINLQAESEIGGYQIYVNLSGQLKDSEELSATVRSSPALPQADVVSLITTGSLANTAGGIPTLAQTGINTAAEILTDTIINNPARKATDKLFGLNVFEIDPIISGQQLNPSARLTVGRQINNNLRVTYATNLSQDQNQVLALEYRVSNKISFVAQYEQRSITNVTRSRDNFSFEIRFRRRF
jgi:translocation and assembly module TamB